MTSKNTRFTKIGSNGEHLPTDATDHVAVLDTTTGLMWSAAASIGSNAQTHAQAEASCAALSLAGFDGWRLPTVEELFPLADRTREQPAIDTDFFACKSDWYWTSTPAAWSAASAWFVYFNVGLADYSPRGSVACVRAVRVDGAKAYCKECNAAGMGNCAHFDECGGARCVTCHQQLNQPAQQPVQKGGGEVWP